MSIPGGKDARSVILSPADFAGLTVQDGNLASWNQVDLFGICAHHGGSGIPASEAKWAGGPASFLSLEWMG